MLIQHIALVSEVPELSVRDLTRVAAAIQKQVVRDFAPAWGIKASVAAFTNLEDIPLDYWPVIIRTDIGFQGAAGIHLDESGQPFALVQLSNHWSLTASHEILEMLADPFGNRLVAGRSIKKGQGRVRYLVEVADPSEDDAYSYSVNGVMVSDFYTPRYFDPVASPGVAYSYTGAITAPRQVLRGGYLSWHEPVSDHWWQCTWFDSPKPTFHDLGKLTGSTSLRSQIDTLTFLPSSVQDRPKTSALFRAAAGDVESNDPPMQAVAQRLRGQIAALRAGKAGAVLEVKPQAKTADLGVVTMGKVNRRRPEPLK